MDELGNRAFYGMLFKAKKSLIKVLFDLKIINRSHMSGAEIIDSVLLEKENNDAHERPWSILRVMSLPLLEALTADAEQHMRARLRATINQQWQLLDKI